MKRFKKIVSVVLFCALMVSLMPSNVASAAKKAKLNKSKATLEVGDTLKLKVKGTSQKVKWSSNKKAVATVSKKGVVKAKKKGSAKITAKVGKQKLVCKVTVKMGESSSEPVSTESPTNNIAVTGISLNISTLNLTVGETSVLTATIAPDNATNKTINWTSSNVSVATVDGAGVVTAIAAGTTTITASADGKVASCVVTIVEKGFTDNDYAAYAWVYAEEYMTIKNYKNCTYSKIYEAQENSSKEGTFKVIVIEGKQDTTKFWFYVKFVKGSYQANEYSTFMSIKDLDGIYAQGSFFTSETYYKNSFTTLDKTYDYYVIKELKDKYKTANNYILE